MQCNDNLDFQKLETLCSIINKEVIKLSDTTTDIGEQLEHLKGRVENLHVTSLQPKSAIAFDPITAPSHHQQTPDPGS